MQIIPIIVLGLIQGDVTDQSAQMLCLFCRGKVYNRNENIKLSKHAAYLCVVQDVYW